MTKFAHSVVIERPLDQVWDYVIEPTNDPVWLGSIIEVRRERGEQLEVGSEIHQVAQFLGRRFEVTLVVTEHEPMRRSAVRTVGGPVPVSGSYTFEPVNGGTRFTMEGEADAHGLFKLAEPVFARLARREWSSSCEVLKEILEAGSMAQSP